MCTYTQVLSIRSLTKLIERQFTQIVSDGRTCRVLRKCRLTAIKRNYLFSSLSGKKWSMPQRLKNHDCKSEA